MKWKLRTVDSLRLSKLRGLQGSPTDHNDTWYIIITAYAS